MRLLLPALLLLIAAPASAQVYGADDDPYSQNPFASNMTVPDAAPAPAPPAASPAPQAAPQSQPDSAKPPQTTAATAAPAQKPAQP